MSEHGIANVGKVALEVAEWLRQATDSQASHPGTVYAWPRGAVQGRQAEADPSVARWVSAIGTHKPLFQMADVQLKFVIDAETKDVTILILDRTSRKVVRTIPPEEMAKLDPGELLQLFV